MKKLFSAIALLLCLYSSGQSWNAPPPWEEMYYAEARFSTLSNRTNTRNAFLANITDSTVLFSGGKPIIGKASWENRKADSTLLLWRPSFVGISADRKFGFSIGPWWWKKDRDKATESTAFGYYATIWEKTDTIWKVAVDLGVQLAAKGAEEVDLEIADMASVRKVDPKLAMEVFLSIDKQYTSQLNEKSVSFLPAMFSMDGRLLRNGPGVLMMPADPKAAGEEGTKFKFIHGGAGMSDAQDIAFTYGTVETIQSGSSTVKNKGYLRIWKRDGKEWKIVADIIDWG